MKRATLIVLIWGQSFLLCAVPTGQIINEKKIELRAAVQKIQGKIDNSNSASVKFDDAIKAGEALSKSLDAKIAELEKEIKEKKKRDPSVSALKAKVQELKEEKELLDSRISKLKSDNPEERLLAFKDLLGKDDKDADNNNNNPPPGGNNDPAPQDQPAQGMQQGAAPAGGQQGQQQQAQQQNQQKASTSSPSPETNALMMEALKSKGVNVPAISALGSSVYGFTKNIVGHALNGVQAFGGAILSTRSGLPSSGPGLQVANSENKTDNRTALLTSAVKKPYGSAGTLTLAVGLKAQGKVVNAVPKKPITAWVGLKAANASTLGYRDSSMALVESAGIEAKPGSGHRR